MIGVIRADETMKAVFGRVSLSLLLMAFLGGTAAGFGASGGAFDGNLIEVPLDIAQGSAEGGIFSGDFVVNDVYSGSAGGGAFGGKLGIYFDENAPSVSITFPSEGYSSTSSAITLQYSGTAGDNPITKYWVQLDSNGWIGNGLNTTYAFTGIADGSHTVYVVATDLADKNSITAQAGFTVNTSTPAGSQGSGGSIIWSPSGGGRKIPDNKIDSTKTFMFLPDSNRIDDTALNRLGENEATGILQPDSRIALQDEVLTTRSISGRVSAAGVNLVFTLKAKNVSGKIIEDMNVVEQIPKEVAKTTGVVDFGENP